MKQNSLSEVKADNSPAPSYLDHSKLAKIQQIGGNLDFLQELITDYIAFGKTTIASLRKLMSEDFDGYFAKLHSLKGASLEIGTSKLLELILDAESLKTRTVTKQALSQLQADIEKVFEITIVELQAYAHMQPEVKTENNREAKTGSMN